MNVIFIDNFDSFSFNLVDELRRRSCTVQVWRNDIDAADALALATEREALIVLSPGPGSPADAGCCVELCRLAAAKQRPLFGVCLGHQAIVEAFGGHVGPAGAIVHGKADKIWHDEGPLLAGLPSPFPAARYHSLAATMLPFCLRGTARLNNGLVMAVEHESAPLAGVQFHPESILSPHGGGLFDNLLRWAASFSTTPHQSPSVDSHTPSSSP